MEKALLINSISQLKYLNKSYRRLYYGSEFCERLIPSVDNLKQAITYAQKNGMAFSLVTPYVTNAGMKKVEALLKLFAGYKWEAEIVINDWGILRLARSIAPKLAPVLGRLLVKQKRGPGVLRLLKREEKIRFIQDSHNSGIKNLIMPKKLPPDMDSYYKGSNVASVPLIHDFLLSLNIKRVEFDNTEQGLLLALPKDGIHASLYLPYVYIATTFFCPSAGCDDGNKNFLRIKPCRKQCNKYVFKLRHKTMPRVIFIRGNTQFYKNSLFPSSKSREMGFDRIVYEPEVPVSGDLIFPRKSIS